MSFVSRTDGKGAVSPEPIIVISIFNMSNVVGTVPNCAKVAHSEQTTKAVKYFRICAHERQRIAQNRGKRARYPISPTMRSVAVPSRLESSPQGRHHRPCSNLLRSASECMPLGLFAILCCAHTREWDPTLHMKPPSQKAHVQGVLSYKCLPPACPAP